MKFRNKMLRIQDTDSKSKYIKTYMSSSSSFIVMVVEGLHFIRQKNALRAPACSLKQHEIFQLEEGHQLLKTCVGDPDPHPDPYVFGLEEHTK
jgi:hypothetical protein